MYEESRILDTRTYAGQSVMLGKNELPGRKEITVNQGQSYVTDVRQGQSKVIEERIIGEQNVQVYENRL